jgi:hypothetical protein
MPKIKRLFKVTIQELNNGIVREYAEIATCASKAKLEVGLYRTQTFPNIPFEIINVERM